MKLRKAICLSAVLIVAVFAVNSHALVEWDIREILKTDEPPVDVAVSADGKEIFVLTETGEVLIYAPDGKLQDKIGVGKHIDQIEIGPQEDMLLLKSRSNQTIDILVIDFIQKIDTSNSPFKGPADAPVVIAIFSDFQ
ncbi:MAG: hypothetical protein HQ552_08370 [Desulfobacteraceae bacterium]|nr:hypothetical protein [Desulfobacteraceae bacterium]